MTDQSQRIQLDFNNVLRVGAQHGLTEQELDAATEQARQAIQMVQQRRQGGDLRWMELPYADTSEILLESDHGVVLRFTPDDGPLWGQAQAKAAELLEAQWRRHNSLRPLADVIRTQAVLLKIEFGHAQYHASLEHARQLDRSYFALLRRLAERAA